MNRITFPAFLLFFVLISSLTAQDSLDRDRILAVNDAVNAYRSSKGLVEMRLLKGLCEIAQVHAEDMAAKRIGFSHEGFDQRIEQVKKRYHIKSYSAAENLFYTSSGSDVAGQTLKGWINSPGHHVNLKGNFKYSGIGIAQSREGWFYVVQIYLND